MTTGFLSHQLGDGYDLVLAGASSAHALHTLTLTNLDRLRRWEPWAQAEPSANDTAAYIEGNLRAFVEGTALPLVIRHQRKPIGSITLRLNSFLGNAELGYWIAEEHEGRGVVTRAARALVSYATDDLKIARIEIRTSTENTRSRRVAERLGFDYEGTLRRAQPIAGARHNVAVYGLTYEGPNPQTQRSPEPIS